MDKKLAIFLVLITTIAIASAAYFYYVNVTYKARQFVVPSTIPISLTEYVSADRYVTGTWGWTNVGTWKTFEVAKDVTLTITFTDVAQVKSAFKKLKIRIDLYDVVNDVHHELSHQIVCSGAIVSESTTTFTLPANAYGLVRVMIEWEILKNIGTHEIVLHQPIVTIKIA